MSEEYDLRKDSEDQRKLLIQEINQIRRKLGMPPRPLDASNAIAAAEDEFVQEEDVILQDDPIILRKALETTRKDLTTAMERSVQICQKNSVLDTSMRHKS